MFEKLLKKIEFRDIVTLNLAVANVVLFIIGMWPGTIVWVSKINPWYYLIVAVILAIIVQIRIRR